MARRRKSSPAGDLIDLVSRLPWWVGVALAGLSYLVLHAFATSPVAVLKPDDLGGMMTGAVFRGLATVAQYGVAVVCLFGAVVSVWRRRQRRELVDNVVASQASGALNGMSWREFEMLVGEGFRLQGYSVTETGGAGPDGGIDLVLRKGGEKYLVQCKQWRAFKVGVPVLRELYGAMAAEGATGGFVVTSGRFTEEARTFANGRNLQLLDGPKLEHMLRDARTSQASQGRGGAAASKLTSAPAIAADTPRTSHAPQVSQVPQAPHAASAQPAPLQPPSCPRCASAMVRRTAKKGAHAGVDFWGCPDYPRCRGTA